ncbi:hypothetical protein SAMN05444266_102210 [Chitinophaga jiangningensis]|uniref:Uncharacterized protein n=1 Tax=Chitinophaga jiangningensis TaxID=1419482 RepID=A0A1M6Y966_9BACT|nr:hypothetical protein [Chitinophaga jiangningensis]SHL14791.1 hypothetical protein SAMN05444266_102210 [Chitinophaga jiangningensis]
MAIQAATFRKEGNSIILTCAPAVAILGIASFADTTSGEDGNNYFEKYFRYAVNGIDYTEWQQLTIDHLTELQFAGREVVYFELKYERILADTSMDLQVTAASLEATATAPLPETPAFNNSVFARYFGAYDPEVISWYINVLQKLYAKGIIPNYMDRENEANGNEDFIAFWESVAHFVSYMVIYARKFQHFYETDFLLSDFITQRGLAVSEANSLPEMTELMEHFYHQIAYRGTTHIYDKKELGAAIDGELLRLINYRQEDELLFNLYKPEHFGWNLGNASPLYKGLHLNDNINKNYETHVDVKDLSKYPVYGDVSVVMDEEKSVMKIKDGGLKNSNPDFWIKVDPRLDYEFSFLVKLDAGSRISVGIHSFDKDGAMLNARSYKDGTDNNYFFESVQLVRNDKYLQVKLFIYNRNRKTFAQDTTEIKQGNDLIFHQDTTYIIPIIEIAGTGSIWGMRMLPMQTNYSRGLVQVNNFISIWMRNRNHSFAIDQVTSYVRHYLIPYNSWMALTDVGDAGYNETEEVPETFFWEPAAPYCETTAWRPVSPTCEEKEFFWIGENATAYCENFGDETPNPPTL